MLKFEFNPSVKVKASEFTSVGQVWAAIDADIPVYWGNNGYQVYAEPIHADAHPQTVEYQSNHFTHRNGQVLSIRYTASWFGGLMDIKELTSLFTNNED